MRHVISQWICRQKKKQDEAVESFEGFDDAET